jgi:segregation and condensation protein B
VTPWFGRRTAETPADTGAADRAAEPEADPSATPDGQTDRAAEPEADPSAISGGRSELDLEHRAVEAVLLCAVEPVPTNLLAELLELPPGRVEEVCRDLADDYRETRRGFQLARVAGGYRLQTDPELASFVERFATEGVSSRLSSAALETLAIIAYKQPVSRAQIAALRGVNVDGVVRLLHQRGLIAEVGHAPGPGQPVLYGTTPTFLEQLGLDSIDQLPPVEDLFPGPEVVEVLEARLRPGAAEAAAGQGSGSTSEESVAAADPAPADEPPAAFGS